MPEVLGGGDAPWPGWPPSGYTIALCADIVEILLDELLPFHSCRSRGRQRRPICISNLTQKLQIRLAGSALNFEAGDICDQILNEDGLARPARTNEKLVDFELILLYIRCIRVFQRNCCIILHRDEKC